jgi:trk system potassium uptake protein TrkA
MRILIAGGGKSGSFLAETLKGEHQVTVIENRVEQSQTLKETLPGIEVINGDACEPSILERAGFHLADVVAALTGDDEDNLVISFLAKSQGKVPLVFARINDPRNEWLFTKEWGVDIAVSSISIIASLVQEEIQLGEIVTLLKLRVANLAIEELTLPKYARAVGKKLSELDFPSQAMVMAIISGNEVKIPRGHTVLQAGDKMLILADITAKDKLEEVLGL